MLLAADTQRSNKPFQEKPFTYKPRGFMAVLLPSSLLRTCLQGGTNQQSKVLHKFLSL